MHAEDPGWRWVSRGLGTNNIGSLALDPSDRSGNTILVGTGETNTPNNSGAGTGLYRSVDGGDRWTRVPTMIVDPAVGPAPTDFTFTRGIGAIAIDPRSPQTIYIGTSHRDAGHDRRARRPVRSPPGSRSRASACTRPRTAG